MSDRAAAFAIRFRIPFLSLAAIASLAALYFIARHNFYLGGLAVLAVFFVIAAAVSSVHLRSIAFGFLAVCAPLPGLLWGAALGWSGIGPSALVLGVVLANVMAGNFLRALLRGEERPARAAWSCLPALIAALAAMIFLQAVISRAGLAAYAAQLVAASLSVILILPLGASLLKWDESFLARAGRSDERRQRLLEKISLVATPRWGISVAGIALVFAVLGWFGAHSHPRHLLALCAIVSALAGGALTYSWRAMLALAAVAATAALFMLWVSDALTPVPMGIFVFLALVLLRRARIYERQGHDVYLALLRAIEDEGAPIGLAMLAVALALTPALLLHTAPGASAILLFDGVAGLFFVPGMVAALYALFPRRRSLDELYGKN